MVIRFLDILFRATPSVGAFTVGAFSGAAPSLAALCALILLCGTLGVNDSHAQYRKKEELNLESLLGTEDPRDAELKQLPFAVPDDPNKLPDTALVITTKGPFEVKLFRNRTPISIANFQHLGKKGIYEGVAFHRYIPNFVIQGGDPTGTTRGGPGWSLPQEIDPDVSHVRGTIGWARRPAQSNPERKSNGSQFYICLTPQPRLDGFYTAFGVVIRGMENVDRLRPGDKILKVRFPRDS